MGTLALDTITTGDYNVCIGYGSADDLNTGYGNSFLGYLTGEDITSGYHNVAMGYVAGKDYLDTINCISIGPSCGDGNYTGDNNIAIGASALGALTTEDDNVAIGFESLNGNNSQGNTCVGFRTGKAVTSGDFNLILGYDAGQSGSPGGAVTTGSNQVCLGDENIANAHIQVDWTIASDKRDKTDVESLDLGLEFINQLEPVTYRWDKRSKYSKDQSVSPDGTHKEEQLEGGFLAQDVEAIEEQYGHKLSDKTNLTFHSSEDEKMYGIKYSKFVPMLVKAVQELSAEVEELKKEK